MESNFWRASLPTSFLLAMFEYFGTQIRNISINFNSARNNWCQLNTTRFIWCYYLVLISLHYCQKNRTVQTRHFCCKHSSVANKMQYLSVWNIAVIFSDKSDQFYNWVLRKHICRPSFLLVITIFARGFLDERMAERPYVPMVSSLYELLVAFCLSSQ